MKFIRNISTNPYFNLALEEHVLKTFVQDEEIFILWQNEPTIVVGKHQNTVEEINQDFVRENGINVVRRLSGGGAVYHDLGNVNFTFILNSGEKELLDFKKFTLPVIRALERFGIKAEQSGRNDITIDGRKISGNAQYIHKNRLLHHGTLLFDSNLDILQETLKVDAGKIRSKGIKSVRSRVANIKEYMRKDIDVQEFIGALAGYIMEYDNQCSKEYSLADSDVSEATRLMRDKYMTWEWNYGESPPFNFKNTKRFDGGKVEVLLDVKDGIVSGCKIFGDFLGLRDIGSVEQLIKGRKYIREEIQDALESVDIRMYFGNIGRDELVSCFFA